MTGRGRRDWVCEWCGASGHLRDDEDIDTKQCDACGELVVPK